MKRSLLNGSLLASSSLIVFLVAEMLLRMLIFGSNSLSIERMNSTHPIGTSGLVQPSSHQEILWELKPNQDALFRFARIRTNSQGLRDREYQQVKPQNTYRIAVIGDSFTMGSGVEIEHVYHKILEERLNGESKGRRFELINFGVGGYSLRQYAAVMKYKALSYDPDLVLIGFCGMNDSWQETPDEKFRKPYEVKSTSHPFFRSFLWELLRVHFARRFPRERKSIDLPYLEKYFGEIGDLSRETRVPVVVTYLSLEPRDFRPIQRLAEENRLFFADASYPFRGKDLSEYIIYKIDPHPSAKGHQLFADAIYDSLVSTEELGISTLLAPGAERRRSLAVGLGSAGSAGH